MGNVRLPSAYEAENVRVYMADARSFQEREVRRSRWVNRGLMTYSVMATAACAALIGVVSYTVPNVRIQPVYMIARDDGTFDTVNSQWELPKNLTDAQKKATFWQYVQQRESYQRLSARDNYEVVSAMSAPEVRERFQNYWNDKIPGSPSPSKIMGEKGVIRVTFRDSELLPNNRFQVRYYRYIEMEGKPPFMQPMIAVLSYQQLDTVPLLQRFQYNPGALIVTAYPGAIQQGACADPSGDCNKQGGF
ncbi:MAG: virB8 [Rhodoferax sp.]|nr:virB8 [Rhodoferax sp.]